MYCLGLWGGTALGVPDGGQYLGHDACAVLLKDGAVVAAVEEERLCRVKHTRRAPLQAMQFCLQEAGVGLRQIDAIGIGAKETPAVRNTVHGALVRLAGAEISPERLTFVEHHVSHGYSAYRMSGFDDALIVTLDGMGDGLSGLVGVGREGQVERLKEYSVPNSLGSLYLRVTEWLGYQLFDEYKVMGLAPYGNPSRFRDLMQELYTFHGDGEYTLHLDRFEILERAVPRRRPNEDASTASADLAAALQETIEAIVLRLLAHFRRATGLRKLCLAGGVAHNCAMNGKIATSGLFDEVFVQPAAHDAGTALGAALVADLERGDRSAVRLTHVFWGPELARDVEIDRELARWRSFLSVRREEDICSVTAERLRDGAVVGWVQGRLEFGPRALGNRSILADPRPPENKDRINGLVKKREAFRPFAPAVPKERARDFFDVPPGADCAFMTCVVDVKPDQRKRLGAVTHVDGSARLQTVDRAINERFWRLLEAFGSKTGLPILLNTSFNNSWEPIVQTVRDAVVCFLTSGLDCLVVGDFLAIRTNAITSDDCLDLIPTQPSHVELRESRLFVDGVPERVHVCRYESPATNTADGSCIHISEEMYRLLSASGNGRSARQIIAQLGLQGRSSSIGAELMTLWERRVVAMEPPETR